MSASEIPVARHKAPARGALAGARSDHKGSGDGKYDPRGTGTAWSHNFLNQKPWHPLNFKNQARAYEAEQETIALAKRNALAKQEFEAEQDYMKTLSYLSPEEQKKHAARQAIAFMYQKPPGMDVVEKKAAAEAEAGAAGGAAAPAGQGGGRTGGVPGGDRGGRGRGRGPPPPPKEGHVKHMLGAVAALRSDERFELKPGTHGLMGRRSLPRGGQAADAVNQQILVSDSDEEAAVVPPDAAALQAQAHELLKAEKRAAKVAKEMRKRKELEAAEAFLRSAGVDPADLAPRQAKKRKEKKDKKEKKHKR